MYLSDMLRTALHYECIWIEIDYPTCNYFLCCIYLLLTLMVDFGVNISTKKVLEMSKNIINVVDLDIDFLNIPAK